jgi:rhamnosyltransferase
MFSGVVVLYHPESKEVIENIKSYIDNLDSLLIIDNSDKKSTEVQQFFRHHENVHYEFLGENKGIAFALNKGIEFARKNKAKWLLTMDQDSKFFAGDFLRFKTRVESAIKTYQDGVIFSPLHKVPYLDNRSGIVKVNTVMTSGNLINMELIDEIGRFDEKLFIDSVDHEICLRINKKGYSVYRIYDIELEHNLGFIETKKFLGKQYYVTHHNALRRYYITRNSLSVARRNSTNNLSFLKYFVQSTFTALLVITLFEKDKMAKLRSIKEGIQDFMQNKYGKKLYKG